MQAEKLLVHCRISFRLSGPSGPRPGVSYRKGKAWLHFHEDKAGLFADVRVSEGWERFCVTDADGRTNLLAFIDRIYGGTMRWCSYLRFESVDERPA